MSLAETADSVLLADAQADPQVVFYVCIRV